MTRVADIERIETVVIGGGQAGLAVGYHLQRQGLPFVILDASDRVGDVWRNRWDSLRLFTPARYNGLDGLPFPAPRTAFPTKDEMADYLETYAKHFDLPVRSGVLVERLSRSGDRFLIEAGDLRLEADQVVVAMGHYQVGRVPAFARNLGPDVVQLHSGEYRSPSQLRGGPVLIVGAGNSGAEIAKELAAQHEVWVAGRATGELPFRIEGFLGRHLLVPFVLRLLFHRLLTVNTPIGRKMRTKMLSQGGPLLRVKTKQLVAAGVQRVPRMAGVQDGQPVLEDGRVLDVANVIWCTGFHPGFEWIDLPVIEGHEPLHDRGIVPIQPGLYFVGMHFIYAASSGMVQGVGRDAKRIAEAIAARSREPQPVERASDAALEAVGPEGGAAPAAAEPCKSGGGCNHEEEHDGALCRADQLDGRQLQAQGFKATATRSPEMPSSHSPSGSAERDVGWPPR